MLWARELTGRLANLGYIVADYGFGVCYHRDDLTTPCGESHGSNLYALPWRQGRRMDSHFVEAIFEVLTVLRT